jgi:hypothetical protein
MRTPQVMQGGTDGVEDAARAGTKAMEEALNRPAPRGGSSASTTTKLPLRPPQKGLYDDFKKDATDV